MVRSRGELNPSSIFSGVRFVLLGFDSVSEEQYRLEITQRGGVDLGKYDPTCTHVIVCGRVYDDPVCVMARDNGKVVITEAWVDDTLDLGARADETKVLYRPVRDLDGIPGSKSLHICLTGYQRQEREDIMRMVTMMGARFSKPLIANQITHLICYKFEGEKFELAKRVDIKLVNHRWLEDCLKAWDILPIDNYTKSGWELEIMEAEARDSEEETDDGASNRQTSSLHSKPSSSVTRNPLIKSPAPSLLNNPESNGLNQNPVTAPSKDVGSETIVNLPIKSPLHSQPNLPTKSPAPGRANNPNSSRLNSIQATTSGTDIGSEKTINLTVKSPALHSGPTTSAGPIPVKSSAVTPLESPETSGLNKNPVPPPEVSLQCGPSSSLARDPAVRSPAPAPGPFNSQGTRDPLATILHEDSGSKKVVNLHVKSPLTSGNHTPRVVAGLSQQDSDFQEKSPPPNSSKDPENLDGIAQIDTESDKMVNLPVKKSPLVTVNHTLNPSTRRSQDPDFIGEKDNMVRTSIEEIQSGEIANLNVKSPLATDARDQNMAKTPVQEISSEKGISLTKVGQSKIEGNSCINPQNEVRRGKGYSVETPHSTKPAAPSLSEINDISSSTLISSTNLVITGNSTTTPQIGIESKKGLSVRSESHLKTPKCHDLSSGSKRGTCEARLSALSSSTATKRSYTRKLKKKSVSPVEQQSDPSVNNTTPKVISGISPQGIEGRREEADRDVEMEKKSVEQSCTGLPQKRKASDGPLGTSPFVANDFEELERINSIPKERDSVTNEQVEGKTRADTSNNTIKPVTKTGRTKRTSLKHAKPPRCSSSNLNNIGLSEEAEMVPVQEKLESVAAKQPNSLDFSSHFGSPTVNGEKTTSTSVAQDGEIEMKDAFMESRKDKVENKMLDIKGLSPDSIEAELNKDPSDASSYLCNKYNHQPSAGARIKKAVAKRSVKGKLQNPGRNVFRNTGSNSGVKPDAGNKTLNDVTREKGEASDALPKDPGSGILREVRSNSSANPETCNKAPENATRDESVTPDWMSKRVRTNVFSRRIGTAKGAASETNKKSLNQKDGVRERIMDGSKLTSDKSNVTNKKSLNQKDGVTEKIMDGSKSDKSNVTMDWLLTSTELDSEKENRPSPAEPSTSNSNPVLKCNKKEYTGHENQKLARVSMDSLACFILSGHRLQRKEFQAVIKKLRGRVCRDTHNWSFQATHFIVPGPVRRTEKFFAAAASGRWILKMEYLTASNEAGRFIEEEPYEWYGTGMTEDSSIGLEAPRKWRLVREQTGHGAFYGMQIVIYGECIAPSLDTMKRAIKAGDGTILATSPPYTRILKSNCVDFAVVPATTPSDDPCVREFLNHQIPCVTSDYLVEYVCKPGCSLSKHVLFQSQKWADKSLQKLTKLCQEVACGINSPLKSSDGSEEQEDLRCAVCGSHDREDVMLICGDENGSVGCGIGAHIDCCDPPLEAVPDDDWFCCKCSSAIGSKKGSLVMKGNKRSKKG